MRQNNLVAETSVKRPAPLNGANGNLVNSSGSRVYSDALDELQEAGMDEKQAKAVAKIVNRLSTRMDNKFIVANDRFVQVDKFIAVSEATISFIYKLAGGISILILAAGIRLLFF
ncbi:MAG: hypothetical protein HAW61_03975 [Candidatus Portiera sp.]|nr:hypothetical protein [Portiera sp.]